MTNRLTALATLLALLGTQTPAFSYASPPSAPPVSPQPGPSPAPAPEPQPSPPPLPGPEIPGPCAPRPYCQQVTYRGSGR